MPASPKEMALALNELLSVYGVPAGWDTGASVYRRLWGHLPGDVLRDSIDRYMASDTGWFPKPGQILALAEHEMVWRRKDLDRAGGSGAPAVPVPAPVARRITTEEATNAVEVFWKQRGGRFVGVTVEPVTTVEPRYVVDEVPEMIAGKPWR